MSSRIKFNTNKGFTFIELLTTVSIVVMVVTPMIYLFDNLTDQAMNAHVMIEANFVCSGFLERVKYDVGLFGSDGILAAQTEYLEPGETRTLPAVIDTYNEYIYYNIPNDYVATVNLTEQSTSLYLIEITLSKADISIEMKSLVYHE